MLSMQNPLFTHTICLACGHVTAPDAMADHCAACGSPWLDARYDYAAAAERWRTDGLAVWRQSLWRYADLLPLTEPDPEITLAEGWTPLIRLYQYERLFDHPGLFVKDERQNPTSSFKDRQAAVAVTALKQAGIRECVLASTGNAGTAYAAYCARAGIKLWLFLTSLVPSEKMREAALYGAEVIKVSGTYDETKQVAAEFAVRRGIHLDRGAKAIPGKESMKTLGFEIAEQLGLALDPASHRFAAPDWYIQAVSGGIGPVGVWKAFTELYTMGLIDRLPKLGIVQAAGCAPMVKAYAEGQLSAEAVTPQTLIHVLATGDPGFSYHLLRDAVAGQGGAMIAVEDGEAFAAMRRIASKAGLSVEPATAVAFAGLEKLLTDGTIAPGETVVVNCSGHTFPAESHVLGDQYTLNLELAARGETAAQPRQREGLSAALHALDEQITTVLVVDDNANDRRLIRRLLKSYKQYRVIEARSGAEALPLVREHSPDLIVTDLTMPEMDGYGLLEALKQDAATAAIPVVVVSAKSLTEAEQHLLRQYSESVWLKGGFETRELVDHIVETLGDLTPAPAAADPAAGSRCVVIIDDNAADRRIARRRIESVGAFRVIEAETGRDGLKAIYEHQPDLVLLDLVLPDLDGVSILQMVQQDQRLREIPVIIYSGVELTTEVRAALETAVGVLPKTLDKDSFILMVEKALI